MTSSEATHLRKLRSQSATDANQQVSCFAAHRSRTFFSVDVRTEPATDCSSFVSGSCEASKPSQTHERSQGRPYRASMSSCSACVGSVRLLKLLATRVSVCSGLLIPSSASLFAARYRQDEKRLRVPRRTHLMSVARSTASFSTSSQASTTPLQATCTLLAEALTSRSAGSIALITKTQRPAKVAIKAVSASASHAGSETTIVLPSDGGGCGGAGGTAATVHTSWLCLRATSVHAACARGGLGGGGGGTACSAAHGLQAARRSKGRRA